MRSQSNSKVISTIKLIPMGGLILSLLVGNSALAQSTDIVVPTGGSTSVPTGTNNRTTPTSTTSTGSTVTTAQRFTCQMMDGQYVVMYQPRSQPGQFFPWATPRTLGGGWDAQKRCVTIAQRLESYRPDGLLELQTAVENGYNTVCVTTEANSSCRIVLTVPPESDPYIVRNSVFENLVTADRGEQTFGVNTYSNRDNELANIYRGIFGNKKPQPSSTAPINLKPYLDSEDGGTGVGLRRSASRRLNAPAKQQPTRRLKPGNFR